jgi:peptidoglycan/xylan/chitin deacetylase (PgdA/CDA1 family)
MIWLVIRLISMSSILFVLIFFITSSYALEKVVILTFDDDWKGQYLYAKPILEKYGFKGTFFVTCNCLTYQNLTYCNNFGLPSYVMTWNDIKTLQNEGHDIQSHGMSHMDLTRLSRQALEYEIGQSKQCLLSNGMNSTIFANAFSTGWDNGTVVEVIAKYYDMARNDFNPLTYLKCDGWRYISKQTDCRTYFDNGTLTYANRYSIRAGDHNYFDRIYMHKDTKILPRFIEAINNQTIYNKKEINAIPILVYHNIDYVENIAHYPSLYLELKKQEGLRDLSYFTVGNSTTDVRLFDSEMKYLYDNGFRVITMSDLGYNKTNNHIYIK